MDIKHLHSIEENVAQYNLKINIAGGREQICLGELARTHRLFGLAFIALWRQASCLLPQCQMVSITLFSSTAISAWIWPCHSCSQDKMSNPSSFCCGNRSCCIPWAQDSPQPSQPSGAFLPTIGFLWELPSYREDLSVTTQVYGRVKVHKQSPVRSFFSWGTSYVMSVGP